MNKAIYFDMDGTIADLYGVDGWLDDIINERTRPYDEAATLVRMSSLTRILNNLQKEGYTLGIVSWLAKNGKPQYNKKTKEAKLKWLKHHMKSINWNEIHIIEYGTPKHEVVQHKGGILFDDEQQNRDNWQGTAYDVNNIVEILKGLRREK
jgi:Fe-S cluster biosynthesis and repair protein YggX